MIHVRNVSNPQLEGYDERLYPRPTKVPLRESLKPHIIALRIDRNDLHRDLLSHPYLSIRFHEYCDVDLIELNQWGLRVETNDRSSYRSAAAPLLKVSKKPVSFRLATREIRAIKMHLNLRGERFEFGLRNPRLLTLKEGEKLSLVTEIEVPSDR